MKITAIIQARMTSTRLPGKVLMDLNGVPMLRQVIARVDAAGTIDQIVVATTVNATDDAVAEYCEANGIHFFRGSESDVLDRYYQAARHFGADIVVRLTADCPLLDPLVIDRVVRAFLSGEYDYVSNTIDVSYPDGLDTEVFSFPALERAWREAKLTSEREHVTSYIWKHPGLFRLSNVKHEKDFSKLRWTVDEPQDLEFVRMIYQHFSSGQAFGMEQIISLLQDHPELHEINADFERNEGYQKSLKEDNIFSKKEDKK